MKVSHGLLVLLFAFVWFGGGLALALKGGCLLLEANSIHPGLAWPWLALFAGCLLGLLRAKFLFARACKRNLARISALERPKLWQFFRPVFFLLLILMIGAGATLSWFAHSSYPFLLGVAVLDLAIAAGLLGSGYVFWTDWKEGQQNSAS